MVASKHSCDIAWVHTTRQLDGSCAASPAATLGIQDGRRLDRLCSFSRCLCLALCDAITFTHVQGRSAFLIPCG